MALYVGHWVSKAVSETPERYHSQLLLYKVLELVLIRRGLILLRVIQMQLVPR
jgi:hypothetical protein